jgi:hypothetical protein
MSEIHGSQEIRCDVKDCKFNDKMLYCTKHDIQIGKTSSYHAVSATDTECDSFAAE